jgi:phosphatidylglycerophosphatase C
MSRNLDSPRITGKRPGLPYAKLVVFDFDHTLYDGDSGQHLVTWLITRHWARKLAAILLAPLLLPMVAWLPTRRHGISGFLWIGSIGVHNRRDLDALIDDYVRANRDRIRARLLPVALEVLHRHRMQGDRVVIATGAPPELARAILDFVAHEDLPVMRGESGRLLMRTNSATRRPDRPRA